MGELVPLFRNSAERPDTQIVAACAEGETAARAELFRLHSTAIYRFLSRTTRANHSDLDDLVQTTFLEAFRAAGKFQGGSQVRTWLFGIAANVARHHARTEGRRRRTAAAYADYPQKSMARPDAEAEQAQLINRVGVQLARLPADQRIAFVLCVLENLPGPEAARALNIREGTLYWRVHKARKALRAAMEGERS